jgi:hypothetical protein
MPILMEHTQRQCSHRSEMLNSRHVIISLPLTFKVETLSSSKFYRYVTGIVYYDGGIMMYHISLGLSEFNNSSSTAQVILVYHPMEGDCD